jgi:hypothetical protein
MTVRKKVFLDVTTCSLVYIYVPTFRRNLLSPSSGWKNYIRLSDATLQKTQAFTHKTVGQARLQLHNAGKLKFNVTFTQLPRCQLSFMINNAPYESLLQ